MLLPIRLAHTEIHYAQVGIFIFFTALTHSKSVFFATHKAIRPT